MEDKWSVMGILPIKCCCLLNLLYFCRLKEGRLRDGKEGKIVYAGVFS